MGKYINFNDEAKEVFLEREGLPITQEGFENSIVNEDSEEIPVVLVDNGIFYAALICDTQDEVEYIRDNPDPRPKKYFKVKREKLASFL